MRKINYGLFLLCCILWLHLGLLLKSLNEHFLAKLDLGHLYTCEILDHLLTNLVAIGLNIYGYPRRGKLHIFLAGCL